MPDANFYITADIRGLEFLISGEFQAGLLDGAIEATALDLVVDMQDAIYEPKRGRSKNNSGPFRINAGFGVPNGYARFLGSHGPSANDNPVSLPGEAPANQTDTLAQSIQAKQLRPMIWVVTVGAYYGFYLEYGTKNMQPRPFFNPALQFAGKRMEYHVKRAFEKIVLIPANTKPGPVSQTPISGITSSVGSN